MKRRIRVHLFWNDAPLGVGGPCTIHGPYGLLASARREAERWLRNPHRAPNRARIAIPGERSLWLYLDGDLLAEWRPPEDAPVGSDAWGYVS